MTNPSPSGYADAERNLDKIMESAAQVVAEFGVNAPMEAIAKRAGVGVGTLYRRFPDRAALIAALGRRYLTSVSQALSDAADSTGDPWTAIRDFVTWVAESGRGTLATALAGLPEDAVDDPEKLREQQQHWQRQLDDLVHRAQADGSMRSDVSAEDLIHLLNVFTCHPGALPAPIAAQPARYLQVMLDGLQVNPARHHADDR
jgi:AcrR family transcriptional regulator